MTEYPVPLNHPPVVPYFTMTDPDGYLDHLVALFGARPLRRTTRQGRTANIELMCFETLMMVGPTQGEDWPCRPLSLYVYVPDVDAAYTQAIAAGAKALYPPAQKFWGDRDCGVTDAFGNHWFLATKTVVQTADEVRAAARESGEEVTYLER